MSDPRLSSYRSGWIPAALVVLASAALPAGADSLDQITVQAQRDRLKQEVNTFVSNAIVQTRYDETLERWNNEKVCPLVAGLNKEQGEFVLARVSQIARDAGAPLGSEKCKANFFVVFTKDPEPGLKQLADHHDAAAFNYETGAQLKKFVETPRPVRVWYNAGTTSVDGANLISAIRRSAPHPSRCSGCSQGRDRDHAARKIAHELATGSVVRVPRHCVDRCLFSGPCETEVSPGAARDGFTALRKTNAIHVS